MINKTKDNIFLIKSANNRAQNILDFWFKETSFESKFKKDDNFDKLIKENFLKDFEYARSDKYDDWQDEPQSCLALIIILDQFSRNLYRNSEKAYEQDIKSRLVLNEAVYAGFIEKIDLDQRLFMLLPLIHSEEIIDHERAYMLLNLYMVNHSKIELIKKFWVEHTNVIKKFNRYPHRNKILKRESTNEEIKFLKKKYSW